MSQVRQVLPRQVVTITSDGPFDGGDFGPNTPSTTTGGLNDAELYLNTIGGGRMFIKAGTYSASTIIGHHVNVNWDGEGSDVVKVQTATGSSLVNLIQGVGTTASTTPQYNTIRGVSFSDNDIAPLAVSSTIAAGGSASGQNVVNLNATTGFVAGQVVSINTILNADYEFGIIASVQAGVSITLVSNLGNSHLATENVATVSALVSVVPVGGDRANRIEDCVFLIANASYVYALDYSNNSGSALYSCHFSDSTPQAKIKWDSKSGVLKFIDCHLGGGADVSYDRLDFIGGACDGAITVIASQNDSNSVMDIATNMSVDSGGTTGSNVFTNASTLVLTAIWNGSKCHCVGWAQTSTPAALFGITSSGSWIVIANGANISCGASNIQWFLSTDTTSILYLTGLNLNKTSGSLTLPVLGPQLYQMGSGLVAPDLAAGVVAGMSATIVTYKSGSNSAAITNGINYTPPAVAGLYRIHVTVYCTVGTTTSFNVNLTYKDVNGTTHSAELLNFTKAGTPGALQTNGLILAAGTYYSLPVEFQIDTSATAIQLSTAGTFTTVTYFVIATLERLQ